jgi:purine nucleoside permease
MLVTILVLSVFVIVALIRGANDKQNTYGSSLEQYIVDRNPQHSGDVERLTAEYNLKVTKGLL